MSIYHIYHLDAMNVCVFGKRVSAPELTFPFVQLLGKYLESLVQEILRKPAAKQVLLFLFLGSFYKRDKHRRFCNIYIFRTFS